MAVKKEVKPKVKLPPGLQAGDLEWPKWDEKNPTKTIETLTMYECERIGWVVCTIPIGGARNRWVPRMYGVRVDQGTVVRVGGGPHVLQQITVYVTDKNLERTQKYYDHFNNGASSAGQIRDRISSRRAQGQVERANGNRSWRWDT